MGGRGSSRWRYTCKKAILEECFSISLRDLLEHGDQGMVSWNRGGNHLSRIAYTVERGFENAPRRIRLQYQLATNDEKLDYAVSIVASTNGLGLARYWFLCPLVRSCQFCGRRVGQLYLPPGAHYFGCRNCHQLTYRSQRVSHSWAGFQASILGQDLLQDFPYLTEIEVGLLIDCELNGGRLPKRIARKIKLAAEDGGNASSGRQSIHKANYLSRADLCDHSGLSQDQLAVLESNHLLLPDFEERYRPKLVGWGRKLAYLLGKNWTPEEIKRWAAGRWNTENPKQWPPKHEDWKSEE